MSTVSAILQTYRAPRKVMLAHRESGADEGTGLLWLFVACILFFVARLPSLSREAHLAGDDLPFFGLALGTFFGTILLAPMLFIVLAALSHLIARALGGQGIWLDARLALFWALLAVTPLVLLQGMVAGFIGAGTALSLVSLIAFFGFLYIWLNSLAALEGNPK